MNLDLIPIVDINNKILFIETKDGQILEVTKYTDKIGMACKFRYGSTKDYRHDIRTQRILFVEGISCSNIRNIWIEQIEEPKLL